MVIESKQIFNLMDTNGRRSDVMNAYKIYLEVLKELSITHPNEKWSRFPSSVKQILFYEKTLEKSKDVFKKHGKYDAFIEAIEGDYDRFISKDKLWIENEFDNHKKVIDADIEKRARHYTSNLVKLGFTSNNREITEVGNAFLNGKVDRDPLEQLLPVDDTNILLIRQLAKLKIFTEKNEHGKRMYYSPFLMALKLLLGDVMVDKNTFETIIQGLSPYISIIDKQTIMSPDSAIEDIFDIASKIDIDYQPVFTTDEIISKEKFSEILTTSKESDRIMEIYYNFYLSLQKFAVDQNQDNYDEMLLQIQENSEYIKKAFGYGKPIFNLGNRGNRHTLEKFIQLNKNHSLLKKVNFNKEFYSAFVMSKRIDGMSEYSDTTTRLFGASGIIKFKNLPELSFKDLIKAICPVNFISKQIFGEMSEDEFINYEVIENAKLFKNTSLGEILGYQSKEIETIVNSIISDLDVADINEASKLIVSKKNDDFTQHIISKYSKETVIELLGMFSNRRNDNKIRKAVNESAPVPTIYEYIIAIAWYYISNCDYDLYSSMNLTLNADFEPVIHAGGGAGDIVINYEKSIVMLEVTLMNKQAQKRGEWEPVLRHSLNIKAENPDKEAITFFVSDELDMNTINIWRAVAAAPLESTNTHEKVDGVIIMPLTNAILIDFLIKDIYKEAIINATKESFIKVPKITDVDWHNDIIKKLF